MSEQLPTTAKSEETLVFYYIDDEDTPYKLKVGKPMEEVTLGDFKAAIRDSQTKYQIHLCKFFFKTIAEGVGQVKEELTDDAAKLPSCDGKIFAYLQPTEGSAHSDGSGGRLRLPGGGSIRGLHPQLGADYRAAAAAFDQTGMTSDSESTVSHNLPTFGKQGINRRAFQPQYGPPSAARRALASGRRTDGESGLTTDTESRLFSDDDERSRISTSTHVTSVSQQFYRQRKRRKKHRAPVSRATSFSSITESSMSLNIITVPLNMDTVNFLGISIVGQSNRRGDGGIFVANIMKGGAVALDGRIEPGDMILQVNKASFENMSNDDAVEVLREAVNKGGRITLVVAKSWDPMPKGYFTIPRQEPVRPIDPGAWVAHTNQFRGGPLDPIGEAPTPTPAHFRPPSVSTLHSHHSGGSYGNSSGANTYLPADDLELDRKMDPKIIVMAMMRPGSGLEIKDRTWLKIKVPRAVLGSDVVDWLHTKVSGFPEKRDARKFAALLLKQGLIKHTVNKITFSEQCYYVFADVLSNEMAKLNLNGPHEGEVGMILPAKLEGEMSDGDTVAPLPPPAMGTPTPPWMQQGPSANTPSMVSGYASMVTPAFGYPAPPAPPSASLAPTPSTLPMGPAEAGPALSAASTSSSSEGRRGASAAGPPALPPKPRMPGTLPLPGSMGAMTMTMTQGHMGTMGAMGGSMPGAPGPVLPPGSAVLEGDRELAGSRQSFRMAMGNPLNPTEFFVDYM